MKVVAYTRVSTDKQAEEGLGLDVQRDAIRAWAKSVGHKVVEWTSDEGVSGSNGLDERTGLLDAFSTISTGRAKGLVIYRLDRLARDLIVQEQLLAELWRMGAVVYSTSAAESGYLLDDPDDPSRRLIRQVLGAVSEYERSMIRLRLRSGRARKASTGGFAYGAPPYGYRAEHGELVEAPDEQEAVSLARSLHAEGASLRFIASELSARGHRPRRSHRWHPEVVRHLLSR